MTALKERATAILAAVRAGPVARGGHEVYRVSPAAPWSYKFTTRCWMSGCPELVKSGDLVRVINTRERGTLFRGADEWVVHASHLENGAEVPCRRCAATGRACRGCSGFAADHPELFGGCGVDVPCPDCAASGRITGAQIAALPDAVRARLYGGS